MSGFYLLAPLIVAVFIVTQTEVVAQIELCPSELPLTSLMSVFNGLCYQFVGEERHWNNARDYCYEHGGRLVKIDDAQTNRFIVEKLNSLWWSNNGVWIGLNDRNAELNWQWVGARRYTSEPVRWTNWGSGHPRAFLHSLRDCVRMVRGRGNWLWHETPCQALEWKYRFICQYEMKPTNPPSTVPTSARVTPHDWQPARGHGRHDPAGSERRLSSSSTVQATLADKSLDTSSKERDEVVVVQPAYQAQDDVEIGAVQSSAHKWYVALIGIAALAVTLFVGLLLRRRRCHRQSNLKLTGLAPLSESVTSIQTAKACIDSPDKLRANILTFSSLHKVKSNEYRPTESRNSNIYEDVLKFGPAVPCSDDHVVNKSSPSHDEDVHDYLAMNGVENGDKYVDTDRLQLPPGVAEHTLPEYANCPDDVEKVNDSTGYDVPRSSNIYSEIPDSDCGIYESLDEIKA